MNTPTPGEREARLHASYAAARARLMNGASPVPKPERPRPLSPFVKEPPEVKAMDVFEPLIPIPDWKAIAREVVAKHDIRMVDLLSVRRDRRMVMARHEVMWRCWQETSLSLPQIGRRLGRDHTTVLHGIRMHEQRMLEATNG